MTQIVESVKKACNLKNLLFLESKLNQFYTSFEDVDSELYKHLAINLAIKPQFYAFRWISLLLSQEFSLPGNFFFINTNKKFFLDVIALWDFVFSSAKRLESVEYFSLAMIQHIREELLNGDFSHNVRLLQVNIYFSLTKNF